MLSTVRKPALAFVARRRETTVAALKAMAPLALGVTNPWLMTSGERPELAAAFAGGLFDVVYVPAHDGDPGLLTPEELVDDVRLNESAVHELLRAPAPERRVVLLPSTVDAESVAALEAHGIDALVVPRAPDEPCRVGERLILVSGVTLLEAANDARGEARLGDLLRELTPPWLPRVDPAAPPRHERPGAAVAEVLGWLCDALGFARAPRLLPAALFDHPLSQLPPRARVPLLLRLARGRGGEPRARELLQLLCIEVELGAQPQPRAALPRWAEDVLPDPSLYQALADNGWRGRDRWLQLYRGVCYGELSDNCMMRSMAIL
jgi:hypothetical protein